LVREEARRALGADFDLRAFHDHLLADGSMPLSALQSRIRAWISQQAGARPGMDATTRTP